MGGRASWAGIALAAVVASGCASVGTRGGPTAWKADTPTLLVENGSGYQVAVYLGGMRIGTATRGRTCLRIPQTLGELELSFKAARGTGYGAPFAFLEESRHWRIELKPGVTLKYDVLGLVPAPASCET